MNRKKDIISGILILSGFLIFYLVPFESLKWNNPFGEALKLAGWYAREHVILCLIPAFFIAGAIGVFLNQASVMRYLGPRANRYLAYGVASVSGTVLAVCSCTVLPLFAGIYHMGAGLGPAAAFLYSGPAINVLAITMTARVLGPEIGLARAIGAIVFALVIGLLMHLFFRKDEKERSQTAVSLPDDDNARPLWQNALFFLVLVLILIFATLGCDSDCSDWQQVLFNIKWYLTGAAALLLGVFLKVWFKIPGWQLLAATVVVTILGWMFAGQPQAAFAAGTVLLSIILIRAGGPAAQWFEQSWGFARQIMPLLFIGVLAAGVLLGRPGQEGFIPSQLVASAVGGNSILANLFASVVGAFMYFATLTEVPIIEGLIGSGMGSGPALALLLAGPALSLPNMLVIRSVIGTRKTIVFVLLVIGLASFTGYLFGAVFN